MFRSISYKIALQFTAFVFLLFLVNGAIFLAVDMSNARRETTARLAQNLQFVLDSARLDAGALSTTLAPVMRDRVRILDPLGHPLFTGGAFSEIPITTKQGLTYANVEGERYAILTSPVTVNGSLAGYIQIGQTDRIHFGDLPLRALVYLLISVTVSALTFFAGLFFAKSSLRPAEQMVERLEQFTQDASHELRTPLATLNSSLDLALKTQKYRDGLVSAKEDVKDISVLVERLLELARLDRFLLQSSPVDLSALITDAVEKQKLLNDGRNIVIDAKIMPNIRVNGDPALIRQVAANLLSNAVKFSKSDGGAINVTLTKDSLTISDTGIGIASEALPHLFDRFFQVNTSRSEGGFGLGLALVKRIVDLHGWTIKVKSKPEKGTTFVIGFKSV